MKIITLFFGCILGASISAQNSFNKEINHSVYQYVNMKTNQDNVYILDGLSNKEIINPIDSNLLLIKLGTNGSFKNGYELNFSDSLLSGTHLFNAQGDYFAGSCLIVFDAIPFVNEHYGIVFCGNLNTNEFWSKRISESVFYTKPIITNSNQLITTNSYGFIALGNTKSGLTSFRLNDGKVLWSNSYKSSTNDTYLSFDTGIEQGNDNLVVGGITSFANNIASTISILSKNGEIESNIVLNHHFFREISFLSNQNISVDQSDNIYVVGQISRDSADWLYPNDREGFIAKFSPDLELIWAKRLSAENFEFEGLKHRVFPNGDVLFVYNTDGDLPVIVGKMDTDGNLLWHRGYSFFNPEVDIGTDGSIYFLSSKTYNPDGTSYPATILAKADPNGDIDGCPQFDACLQLFDMDISYSEHDWIREPADTFGSVPFTVEPFSVTVEDHCGTPPPPNANFHLPDTICQSECLRPDSLYNFLAHGVEWTITDPDGNQSTTSDTSFRFCFETPGKWQIEQEVWLLGCSEFFTRDLFVLDADMNLSLGSDSTLCESTPFRLSPNADRTLRSFLWQNGDTADFQTITNSGIYTLRASDGFCEQTTQVELTFLEDIISGDPIRLPNDTTLCEDLLPLVLRPQSDYANEFFLNDDDLPKGEFNLSQSGSYQIRALINNCPVSATYNLEVTGCEVPIFIPSSFSPNDDGINDVIEAFGSEHTPLRLEIFDRWGGMLFQTDAAPFAWDGGEAAAGVYVLVFHYLNQRNGKEESVAVDVTLVR